MSGASLTTKGLVSGGFSIVDEPAPVQPPPPESLRVDVPHNRVMIIIPTAVNLVLIVAENVTDNLRARQASSIALPSLYQRAFMATREMDEIALVKPK